MKNYFLISILFILLLFSCSKSKEEIHEKYLLGKKEFNNQSFEKASILFEEVISSDSTFVAAYLMNAKCHIYNKSREKAVSILEKAANKFPENASVHFLLGRTYLDDPEKIQNAKEEFERVLELDERYFDANYYLAKIYEKQNDFKNAKINYDKALAIKQEFNKIHKGYGDLYKNAGEEKRAKLQYDQITKKEMNE